MVWGERREEGSGWGTHVCLWQIHFDVWQNKYNIVKFKNKIKFKKIKIKNNKYFQEYWGRVPIRFYHPMCPEAQGLLVWKKTKVSEKR